MMVVESQSNQALLDERSFCTLLDHEGKDGYQDASVSYNTLTYKSAKPKHILYSNPARGQNRLPFGSQGLKMKN